MGTSYRDGKRYYKGYWDNNLPEGEGRLYEDGKLVCKGDNWVIGRLKLENGKWMVYGKGVIDENEIHTTVTDGGDLIDVDENVTTLVIDKGACDDSNRNFVIDGFNNLKILYIKKESMRRLNSLKISNCNSLEKIETEDDDEDSFNIQTVEISSIFFF